jgi:hypothetical protein
VIVELPFMSVNLARRARALQTLRLPDDVAIPDTSQRGSYRRPSPEKYAEPPTAMSMRPKYDNSLQSKYFNWVINIEILLLCLGARLAIGEIKTFAKAGYEMR